MLPAVLLGCAWWQRGRVVRQDWLRAAPYFIFALTFGLLTIWFQSHQAMGGTAVQTESFWGRLAGAGFALWFYLGKALLPLNLNLIYPRWHLDAASPLSWLPLLLWFGLLGLCWRFRRGWGRHALFGLGCFTLNLFPVLGLFDMYFLALSRVSDHFLYLPLIAVLALAAAALKSLFFRLATYFAASRHSTNPVNSINPFNLCNSLNRSPLHPQLSSRPNFRQRRSPLARYVGPKPGSLGRPQQPRLHPR